MQCQVLTLRNSIPDMLLDLKFYLNMRTFSTHHLASRARPIRTAVIDVIVISIAIVAAVGTSLVPGKRIFFAAAGIIVDFGVI